METKFYVQFNAKLMGIYKSIKPCLNLISRKGWKNNYYNELLIFDNNGNLYDTQNGTLITDEERYQ